MSSSKQAVGIDGLPFFKGQAADQAVQLHLCMILLQGNRGPRTRKDMHDAWVRVVEMPLNRGTKFPEVEGSCGYQAHRVGKGERA